MENNGVDVDAPAAITISPRREVVVGQMGEINDQKDSLRYENEKKKWDDDMKLWEEKAVGPFLKEELRLLEERKKDRMPYVIVPDEPKDLGIDDKEGNVVFRIVAYKPQLDDAVKALRKKGYIVKPFQYDKEKWEAENVERKQL